ncbi:MAG: Crp/Fnr family transcriptional regulator [Ottowia sp.]|nr:Crp/Fnr family transcriptional regulator [Ottowia sp.]
MDLQKFDIPRYLATLPMFAGVGADDLQRLVQDGCQLRRVERGRMIFRAGQECGEFHVTVLGQVKLFVVAPSGAEKVIDLCGPGHSFGRAEMFMGAPAVVSAQALTEVLLLTIEREATVALMRADADFMLRMLAGLSRLVYGLAQDVRGYTLYSGVQRVIGYLLGEHMCERSHAHTTTHLQMTDKGDGAEALVQLPASKAAIASRLSLTPEYFSRVLSELEAAGLIEVQRRTIRIMDVEQLASYQAPRSQSRYS